MSVRSDSEQIFSYFTIKTHDDISCLFCRLFQLKFQIESRMMSFKYKNVDDAIHSGNKTIADAMLLVADCQITKFALYFTIMNNWYDTMTRMYAVMKSRNITANASDLNAVIRSPHCEDFRGNRPNYKFRNMLLEFAKQMINDGVLPNAHTFECAIEFDCDELIQMLVQQNAPSSAKCLELALQGSYKKSMRSVINFLMSRARTDQTLMSVECLERSLLNGYAEQLLDYGCPMTSHALHWALQYKKFDLAHRMITSGCPITEGIFECMISSSQFDIAELLLQHGCPVGTHALDLLEKKVNNGEIRRAHAVDYLKQLSDES